MVTKRRSRARRALAVVSLVAFSSLPFLTPTAVGGESLGDLKARMKEIRAELSATAQRVDDLYGRERELQLRIEANDRRIKKLAERNSSLLKVVIKRANAMYRSGNMEIFEALFGARDFTELSDRAELLAQATAEDNNAFIDLARGRAEFRKLQKLLSAQREDLRETAVALKEEGARLREKLAAVSDEYKDLQRRLAALAPAPISVATPIHVPATNGMACPVAGPVAFVDSWGSPRSGGRAHQGVDMMANYGTAVVAITDGTITGAGYHSLGGNNLWLTSTNGDSYYYAHNRENIVTGGSVRAGQQIATVGDTGNAAGTPHLHFEFHPGGGGAVNPYPLVSRIC